MTMSLKRYPSLEPIAKGYSGILLDAYGVFWGGNDFGVFPGAISSMEKLVSDGKIVGILSNATQLAEREREKLQRHGISQGKHYHFLITSGEVARSIFQNEILPFETPRKQFWLFGGVHPKFSSHEAIFKDSIYREAFTLDEADFIYISVPHIDGEDQIDPELFREEVAKIRSFNLPMVCPNPDLFAHEGKERRAVVRQGSIAKLYEEMGGHVYYIGKPHSKAYSIALEQFLKFNISDPKSILMVGDTPETDIRGASQTGMDSALILETGIMADRIARQGLEKAISALPSQDIPNFLIGTFAHGF